MEAFVIFRDSFQRLDATTRRLEKPSDGVIPAKAGNDGEERILQSARQMQIKYHMQNYISYLQHNKMQVSIFQPSASNKRDGKILKIETGHRGGVTVGKRSAINVPDQQRVLPG
ncbi:hypothetical protein [Rhodanobacter koreensis]